MKAVGVIVEHNPFHNGHFYHLQQSKKQTGANVIIAVMSGYFLQRGEPALVSKWARAEMALRGGADIVIELPYAFSTQKAEIFAHGAVSILNNLFVDELCFGSEDGDIDSFKHTIKFLDEHTILYNEKIRTFIKQGHSYPKAVSLAFHTLNPNPDVLDLSQPNNILGFHYLKAIKEQKSSMKAAAIKRIHAGYHDKESTHESIASATSIRKRLLEDQSLHSIYQYVPESTYHILNSYFKEYKQFQHWEHYFSYLKYKLLTGTNEEFKEIYEVEEGIENRMIEIVKASHTFYDFMEKLKTKRYTWTRLQRICTHILTNAKKEDMQFALETKKAPYLRLLGMSQNGQQYLNKIKKEIDLPLISTVAKLKNPLLSLDQKASHTYTLGLPSPLQTKQLYTEYSTPPIRLDTPH
ncbi:nucleotidyltransferase [Bacillus taeanensis]|uniref:tRNA(Met) cytidine acetate ligase n=1 Tax=Bacillus taeanensis TaxID=273032 RepID=A0A366XX59_9BACI|nr:nucleotidyltransferase [Bacillus taeanensis]RBW70226.1 nucleotidyltransferase [Bacillus taeanensis]